MRTSAVPFVLIALFGLALWTLMLGEGGAGAAPAIKVASPPPKVSAPLKGDDLTREAGATESLKPFALVELFTSQGCSSCPPADALLIELDDAGQRGAGRRIFPLSFHVDYWDRLGWADPFASAAFTARQRAYSQRFGWGTYTPQVVIDGQVNAVGNRSRQVWGGVETAFQKAPKVPLRLKGVWQGDRAQLDVTYALSPEWSGPITLHLALAEPRRTVAVERGENGGRALSHGNVVRVFESIERGGGGEGARALTLPGDWGSTGAVLVAYAQDPASYAILGAQILRFESAAP